MSTKNTDTTNVKNAAFTVRCIVSGETKKVRQPVFQSRIARVQKYVRTRLGSAPTVAEAIAILNARYVSAAARRSAGVNFLNVAKGSL